MMEAYLTADMHYELPEPALTWYLLSPESQRIVREHVEANYQEAEYGLDKMVCLLALERMDELRFAK